MVPSNTPLAREVIEIVLFVGPPYAHQPPVRSELMRYGRAAGKTSFFRKHFAPQYQHVNQDILKSRDKCLAVAEQLLLAGRPVVVGASQRPGTFPYDGAEEYQTTPIVTERPEPTGSDSHRESMYQSGRLHVIASQIILTRNSDHFTSSALSN